MMFSGFSDEEFMVRRLRPAISSDRGDVFLDHSRATPTAVDSADVQPAAGAEQSGAGRDATLGEFMVLDYSSPRGFWQDTDRVEINGTAYQIEGSVREVPSPTGGLSHTQLIVNRWEG